MRSNENFFAVANYTFAPVARLLGAALAFSLYTFYPQLL